MGYVCSPTPSVEIVSRLRLATYGLRAKSNLLPVFIKRVLLEQSYTHSFAHLAGKQPQTKAVLSVSQSPRLPGPKRRECGSLLGTVSRTVAGLLPLPSRASGHAALTCLVTATASEGCCFMYFV